MEPDHELETAADGGPLNVGRWAMESPPPRATACYGGTHGGTSRWLPDEGVVLTRDDLERSFLDLRALIGKTDAFDANLAHAVDIAVTITRALERASGGER